MSTEKYLGSWHLIPELCIYQSGEPPLEGTYTISKHLDEIRFSIHWRDKTGKNHQAQFGGPLDGQNHPLHGPGITDVSYKKIDEQTLDSSVFNVGKIVMYARRVTSGDGELLAVSQVIHGADGMHSNFQVYRRSSS